MSIFFYKRLLGTDAINSLLFFKDVFFSLIEKGPGNKDIYLLSSKLNVKNATPTFLELGPAWAKEISHQTLDTELSDLARPIAGGLPAGLAEDEELVLGVTAYVHGDTVPGTSTESSRWSDWIPVFIFSILDIRVAYFGAANLVKFSDNCLKNFFLS